MKPLQLGRALCVGAVSLFLCAAPASAEDYTDIWWAGPSEDGWGVNLAQNQDVIFATLFVHGPAPSTTEFWYVATLDRTPGGLFTGDLYQTTGTGIGATWNPAQKTSTKVGTATFAPTSSTSGRLTYNVGPTMVVKDIVRQTLRSIALGGNYIGTAVIVFSSCQNSADNGMGTTNFDPTVTQTVGGQLQLDFLYAGTDNCTFSGAYSQEGMLFRIPAASYVCSAGSTKTVDTTATLYEVKATSMGLEGRWNATGAAGCTEDGTFSAVFQ